MASSTEGHGRVQAAGVDIFRSFDRLRFGPIGAETLSNRNYRVEAPVPGCVQVPVAGLELVLEVIENAQEVNLDGSVYNEGMGWLDPDRVSGSLILRNWRPGDQYQPANRSHAEKIKTLFQEFRIPLWERRHWPVLIDGEDIIWSRRFGAAAGYAANPGSWRALEIRESQIGHWASNLVAPGVKGSEVS
jgi:tRNA(Ile)-lysidine synthase